MKTQLLLFGSPTCVPCKSVKLNFEANGYEYDYVDCTENPELAAEHQVMSTPTLVYIKDGELVDKAVGANNAIQLADKVAKG